MSVPIKVAKWSGTFPEVQSIVADAAASTIRTGYVVALDSDGELIACASAATAFVGVALGDFNGAAGYGMPSGITQVTGRAQKIPVAMAVQSTLFELKGSSAAAITDIDNDYGITLTGSGDTGIFTLDKTNTTQKVFHVVDVDVDRDVFFCRFLAAGNQAVII